MIETSSLTFSDGRDEMNMYGGSRGRFGGVVAVLLGFDRAKQTFLPPVVAVYAPHSPYCPSRFGVAPPTVGTAAFAAAGLVLSAGFAFAPSAGFGLAAGFLTGFAGAACAWEGCCCAYTAGAQASVPSSAHVVSR